MFPVLKNNIATAISNFTNIPQERRGILDKAANSIKESVTTLDSFALTFVCTHNSRRSIFGQALAFAAFKQYNLLGKASSFSAGTESTYLHPNAIASLRRFGFKVNPEPSNANPSLEFKISESESFQSHSTTIEDTTNPNENFIAIMVCSSAEQACPFVPGCLKRIPITYEDPKIVDNTPEQDKTYDERCMQMATEIFYLISNIV